MKSIILAAFLLPTLGFADCQQWSGPQAIGENEAILRESSGVAVSALVQDRLYQVNDSGSGPYFYQTDRRGRVEREIRIANFHPVDMEDLGYGRCGSGYCLWLADIGDNREQRATIRVVRIREQEDFPSIVVPEEVLELAYPDGPHNAESFAVHPNGDFFLVTKEKKRASGMVPEAQVFRIAAHELRMAAGRRLIWQPWARVDIASALPGFPHEQTVATSIAISPSGNSFLVLTYGAVLQWNVNLAMGPFLDENSHRNLTQNVRFVEQISLPQQEAIAFTPRGDGFIFTSESNASSTPIMEVSCRIQTWAVREVKREQ